MKDNKNSNNNIDDVIVKCTISDNNFSKIDNPKYQSLLSNAPKKSETDKFKNIILNDTNKDCVLTYKNLEDDQIQLNIFTQNYDANLSGDFSDIYYKNDT